jgi:hypothetical protein
MPCTDRIKYNRTDRPPNFNTKNSSQETFVGVLWFWFWFLVSAFGTKDSRLGRDKKISNWEPRLPCSFGSKLVYLNRGYPRNDSPEFRPTKLPIREPLLPTYSYVLKIWTHCPSERPLYVPIPTYPIKLWRVNGRNKSHHELPLPTYPT